MKVGTAAPKTLGLDSLLDFSVEPTLDGETLEPEEWQRLLEGADGLALLKGKCGICPYKDFCGGSRSRAYAVSGDYLAEEPCCSYQPIQSASKK